jgi:uncharacterized protein YndB with AHSA1/START domain
VKQEFLYSVEREYPVGLETLWSAWAQAEELEKWYSPTMLSVVPGSATSETKIGGRWAIGVDVSMNGFNAYFWGRYSEVVENEKLVHSLSYSQSPEEFEARDDNAPFHTIVVEFEPRPNGSWVKFSQFGEMPEEQIEATRDGMGSYFDNLEIYLGR